MFKKLEAAWNARTPVWLHNGTKENLIFQIIATIVVVGSMIAWEEYKDRRDHPALHQSKRRTKK